MGCDIPLIGLTHDPYKQEMEEILYNMKNKKLKVYYAHFMGIYNTIQEKRDIKTLESLGLEVYNPNQQEIQRELNIEFARIKAETGRNKATDAEYLEIFAKVFNSKIEPREVFAFRALPDGRIPGGVALELRYAQSQEKIIIELPGGTHARSMGKEDTREYLRDMGQR